MSDIAKLGFLGQLDTALQDSRSDSPPAAVQQRNCTGFGCDDGDRDAVGHGDGQENGVRTRRMTVGIGRGQAASMSVVSMNVSQAELDRPMVIAKAVQPSWL